MPGLGLVDLESAEGDDPDNDYSEVNLSRPDSATEDLVVVGVGLERQFVGQNLFEALKHFRHTYGFSFIYASVNDEYMGKTYTGPGLKFHYSLYKLLFGGVKWGLQFGYSVASVKRGQIYQGEPNNDRRMYLSWFDLGLGYRWFF